MRQTQLQFWADIQEPTLRPPHREADRKKADPFAKVPVAVLRCPRLSSGAVRMYGLLISYAWADAKTFPRMETLEAASGLSQRSIRRHLQELETAQLVRVRRQGLGRPNLYTFLPLSSFHTWLDSVHPSGGHFVRSGADKVSAPESTFLSAPESAFLSAPYKDDLDSYELDSAAAPAAAESDTPKSQGPKPTADIEMLCSQGLARERAEFLARDKPGLAAVAIAEMGACRIPVRNPVGFLNAIYRDPSRFNIERTAQGWERPPTPKERLAARCRSAKAIAEARQAQIRDAARQADAEIKADIEAAIRSWDGLSEADRAAFAEAELVAHPELAAIQSRANLWRRHLALAWRRRQDIAEKQ